MKLTEEGLFNENGNRLKNASTEGAVLFHGSSVLPKLSLTVRWLACCMNSVISRVTEEDNVQDSSLLENATSLVWPFKSRIPMRRTESGCRETVSEDGTRKQNLMIVTCDCLNVKIKREFILPTWMRNLDPLDEEQGNKSEQETLKLTKEGSFNENGNRLKNASTEGAVLFHGSSVLPKLSLTVHWLACCMNSVISRVTEEDNVQDDSLLENATSLVWPFKSRIPMRRTESGCRETVSEDGTRKQDMINSDSSNVKCGKRSRISFTREHRSREAET